MLHQYYGIPNDASWDKFMDRFPILFQESKKDMTHTCMCWGIECPIGWFHILEQLCTVLEFYNMEFTKNHGIAIVADQVKEKFGTLRFYYTVRQVDENGIVKENCPDLLEEDDRKLRINMDYLEMLADNIIREADGMTEKTCADCGVPLDDENFVETEGWISYICKECDEKRHKEWEEDLKKMKEEKYTPEPKENESYPECPTDQELFGEDLKIGEV